MESKKTKAPLTIGDYYNEMDPIEQQAVHAALTFLDLTFINTLSPRLSIPVKTDPRNSKNWKAFVKLVVLCQELSKKLDTIITPRFYMRCIIYHRYSEREFVIYPNMLISEWALERFMSIKNIIQPERENEDRKLDLISTIKLSDQFIKLKLRKYNLTNIIELLTMTLSGKIVPQGCLWAYNGLLTVPWCLLSKSFWQWIEMLPKDILEEYIDLNRINETRTIFINTIDKTTWREFRSVLEDDLLHVKDLMRMEIEFQNLKRRIKDESRTSRYEFFANQPGNGS